MSLLINTKNKIKNKIQTIANYLIDTTKISYGFIGLTTAILGYYTFFENNIEKPLPDTLASPSESNASTLESTASSPASSPESTASSPSESIASSNPSDEKPIISGGKKNKKNKTKKKK
jgi:cytoskeletal protein RodZ